jgi:RNA polymerase sigma-70 factor (ECF subfamily)
MLRATFFPVFPNTKNGAMDQNRFALIIEGCRRQDRTYQKELYQLFYLYALKTALEYASSLEDAREIVNDVFLKVFDKIEKYRSDQAFKPWIHGITVHTAIDHYRKNIRHKPPTDQLDTLADQGDPVNIIARISAEELRALVQKLSPAYRAAINLHAIEGYDHQEIAAMLGITVGASKSNLFKARARLKALLLQFEWERVKPDVTL